MALIGMAVYCTEQNQRDKHLVKTLHGLAKTVDFTRHSLGVSVNGFTDETLNTLDNFESIIKYKSFNVSNLGTAEAVNKVWQNKRPGEHCIKMDDDIYIHSKDWIEELEEVVGRDPAIGQVALKRNDLWENTKHENEFYRTTLHQLPHQPGQRWIIVERTNHCIGSCVLHSAQLLAQVGYLKQPSTYGLDDTLMSMRSRLAGFKNVFLPHIVIDHLEGSPVKEWQDEKNAVVNSSWAEYNRLVSLYETNPQSIYYNPFQ